MSSLSFDNLFPPDAGDGSEQSSIPTPSVRAKRLPASWSEPLPASVDQVRTFSGASPWVLSATRRSLEFFIALTALIVFFPLMLLAAVLVRMGSDGPVFFRQKRMGRNGREFTLYKFRSMRPEDGSGSSITVIGDSRITPVGAILRRYKLDELPQFWNVLRGDMSLVGPRPKLPHHEALHMPCRPGITGVATLAFRREEEFLSGIPEGELEGFYEMFVKPAKATLDLDYIVSATIFSDLAVLWRTAVSCLSSSCNTVEELAEIVARHASDRAASARAHAQRVHPAPATPSISEKRPRTAGFAAEV